MEAGHGPFAQDEVRFRALLRQVRLEGGLRQQDLAAQLDVPQSWVSKVESGERRLDVLELRRLCHALGLTLAEFVLRLETELAGPTDRADPGPDG